MISGTAAAAAISAVKNLSDLVRGLKPEDPKVAKQQLSDLLDVVIDVKKSVVALTDENDVLSRQLAELKRQQSQPPELEFRDNFYWQHKTGGATEGPFCPGCHDKDHRFVRLASMELPNGKLDGYRCTVCKFTKYLTGSTVNVFQSIPMSGD